MKVEKQFVYEKSYHESLNLLEQPVFVGRSLIHLLEKESSIVTNSTVVKIYAFNKAGKGKNTGYQQFFLFQIMFSKAYSF